MKTQSIRRATKREKIELTRLMTKTLGDFEEVEEAGWALFADTTETDAYEDVLNYILDSKQSKGTVLVLVEYDTFIFIKKVKEVSHGYSN